MATDLATNQITVTVPDAVGRLDGAVRATLALGVYDVDGDTWALPAGPSATATAPGGAGPLDPQPAGIFNLGFRFDEAVERTGTPPDTDQSLALRAKEPTRFAHEIDVDALRAGVTDRSGVPTTGQLTRIYTSRLDLGEGRDLNVFPEYRSPLQSYSITVPSELDPAAPPGLVLNLHSLGAHQWQYNGSTENQQLGPDAGAILVTPEARGEDGWYQHEAEVDVFEVWHDVARHYRLDPDRVLISGYSMGGYGTYRLGGRYPDLFGAAYSIVGPPGEGVWLPPAEPSGGAETLSNRWLENVRNIPFRNDVGAEDQLVPIPGPRAQNLGAPEQGIDGLEQLGYRYEFRVHGTAEHLTLYTLDDYQEITPISEGANVDREPFHVTFSVVPDADDPELGMVSDHAYWVSGVRLADDGAPLAKGTVDAESYAFGVDDPPATSFTDAGEAPVPWTAQGITWDEPPAREAQDALALTLDNVGAVTVDAPRAGFVDGAVEIEVTSDEPAELRLTGPYGEGAQVLEDPCAGPLDPPEEPVAVCAAPRFEVPSSIVDGAVVVPVEARTTRLLVAPAAAASEDPPPGVLPEVRRVGGADRIATALRASGAGFEAADTVVVAAAGNFPDALAAGPLATRVEGPILLVGDSVDDALRAELDRLGATRALVVGGVEAVPSSVDDGLEEAGLTVERVAGPDRFVTAARIADRVGAPSGEAFVVSGAVFPDALSAGPLAAAAGSPILLVAGDDVPPETAAALDRLRVERTVIVGGTAVVGEAVEEAVPAPQRVAGAERYATNAAVLRLGLERGLTSGRLGVATGRDFPDALAATPVVAAEDGLLLLVDGQRPLAEEPGAQVDLGPAGEVLVFGGRAAISDEVLAELSG